MTQLGAFPRMRRRASEAEESIDGKRSHPVRRGAMFD